jgi:membrane dipeptidase
MILARRHAGERRHPASLRKVLDPGVRRGDGFFTRRRILQAGAAASGLCLAGPLPALAAAAKGYSRRVKHLVLEALAIDMLGVITINDVEWERWANSPDGMTAQELERFRTSGIRVFHHSVGLGGFDAYEEALGYFAAVNGFVARYADTFVRIGSVRDIDALKRSGKVGILPGVQNSDHFRTPDDVKTFHDLGQRVSQLTYNRQNFIGCGSTERQDCGLTDFGVAIVGKMNEVGMVVDVSHCGERTTLDAFAVSKKPVAITHSNCRALVDHPRLKTDDAIRKMAAGGGVMGITGVRMFVRDQEPTTLDHIVDHIAHVAKMVGVEHVGIGTDCDLSGYDVLPPDQMKHLRGSYKQSYAFRDKIDIEGFDHPKKFFDLTEALLRRGFGDADVKAILGGNWRRLLGQAWDVPPPPPPDNKDG